MNMHQYRRLATNCGIFVIVCFGVYQALSWVAKWRENVAAREQAVNWEICELSSNHNAYLRLWNKLLEEHGTEQAALRRLRAWAEAQIDWKVAETAWKNGLATRPDNPPPLVNWTDEEMFEDW